MFVIIKGMVTAIYARVSTTDQDCTTQLAEVRQYAATRGWAVLEENEYVDTGWSGAKASRPAMDRLMKDALARKVDTILVYKLDRFGRSLINLMTAIGQLTGAGVRFIAITQGIDTDASNPASRLLLHVMGAFAEFEREIIKERIACGMKKAQASGTRSGKAIGRPMRILNRQAVWDKRDKGASITELQNEFKLGRGHVQRVLAARPVPALET